MMNKRAQPM